MNEWKQKPDEDGNLEWFNPESRLRIQLRHSSLSKSWHVFVYRKRKKPPAKGQKAPSHSMFFDDLNKARKYIQHLLSVKKLDFNYLNNIQKKEKHKKITWMKDLIIDFFLNTAFFTQPNKHIDPLIFERDGITLKAQLKEEGTLGNINLHITPISKHDIVRKHYKGQNTLLYFKHQNPFMQMTKDRQYYHDLIDKLVRRVYWTTLTMDTIKETTDKIKKPHSININKHLHKKRRQLK